MQTVLITGGTGLIGKVMVKHLIQKGYKVIILTRSTKNKENTDSVSYASWDIKTNTIDINAIQSADHIIHLAGAGVVDKKWTKKYKKEIVESRTLGSRLIIDTLKQNSNKLQTIISASAIGWYGPDQLQGKSFTEADKASEDFLGQTCLLWEEGISAAPDSAIRICKIRTGIALSNEGGALKEFKKPVKFGIAAILGNGKQVVSWIHIDDLCRIYIYAMENKTMQGSYNAVAPVPVSNKQLTLTLARKLKGNFFISMHIPVFVLKLMLGSRSIEVLKSTTVSCAKIREAGFTFLYPGIEAALNNLAAPKDPSS